MSVKNKKRWGLIEKIIFFEVTREQFLIPPPQEYWKTLGMLTELERNYIDNEVYPEIKKIFNYINSNRYSKKDEINSIQEFNDKVEKVSKAILDVCNDFDLTLKHEPSKEFLKHIKYLLGGEFLKKFLGN